jgi:peptidoglycan/LPS O-acetylase OafA/YrhL
MIFFSAARFIGGVVGTMLLGGALEQLTHAVPMTRIAPLIGLGLIGVILFDPRGRWPAFFAVLIGSLGLAGLSGVLRSRVSWHDINIWRVMLYTACLASFFIWTARNKKLRSKLGGNSDEIAG